MAALCDHLLYEVEFPVLSCIFQFALDYRLSTLDEVQVVEGICNESELLSSLLLRVKPYRLLWGTIPLFSKHIRSLEFFPSWLVWSNVLVDGIKLSPKL